VVSFLFVVVLVFVARLVFWVCVLGFVWLLGCVVGRSGCGLWVGVSLVYLGIIVRYGSGVNSAVAYTASAMDQKTSSCVPYGWLKLMAPSFCRL
jgi:hypothetical protein